MHSGPSTAYSIMHVLWQGNVVKIIGESNGWYQIKLSDGRVGWSSSQYLSLNTRQAKVDAVINQAKSLLGLPFTFVGSMRMEEAVAKSKFGSTVWGQNKSDKSTNRVRDILSQRGSLKTIRRPSARGTFIDIIEPQVDGACVLE